MSNAPPTPRKTNAKVSASVQHPSDLLPSGIEVDGLLWPTSYRILHELNNRGLRVTHVDPHDADDTEGSDLLWIERRPDDIMCEVTYYRICDTPVGLHAAIDDDNITGPCTQNSWFWPVSDSEAVDELVELIADSIEDATHNTNAT